MPDLGNPAAAHSSVLMMRSALTVIVAGLLVCAAASAQSRPRPAQPASTSAAAEKPGTVQGTVLPATGEPLRKAEVTLRAMRGGGVGVPGGPPMGPGTAVTTTDAGGNFAFEAVPPGKYVLSVQKPGYVRTDYTARGASPGPGGRAAPTVLDVTAGGTTSGIN